MKILKRMLNKLIEYRTKEVASLLLRRHGNLFNEDQRAYLKSHM